MSLEAGKLRHRVRIERLAYALDSNGDQWQDPVTGASIRNWTEVATVWADVDAVSAREFMQSKATQGEISARIVIRTPMDFEVDPTMRIVHTRIGRPDVVYNIHGALPDQDSGMEYLTMPVTAGVSDGQ